MSYFENIDTGGQAGDRTRAHRSNLFLAASIEVGGTASPVKIRNLSETGGMLEGPAFPAIGTALMLRRQEVEIEATVVWLRPPRCGVAFQGRIGVAEWVSGKRSPPDFGQGRADEIQADTRANKPFSGTGPITVAPAPKSREATDTEIDQRVAEELAFVRRILDSIGDELVDEPVFLQRHAKALQGFDLAGQILGNLANVLKAEDREAAIRAIGMEELRARLQRKALFDRQ